LIRFEAIRNDLEWRKGNDESRNGEELKRRVMGIDRKWNKI